jgi:hypothetical protein
MRFLYTVVSLTRSDDFKYLFNKILKDFYYNLFSGKSFYNLAPVDAKLFFKNSFLGFGKTQIIFLLLSK